MDMRSGSQKAVYQFSGEAGKRKRKKDGIRARIRKRRRRRLYKWIAFVMLSMISGVVAALTVLVAASIFL